MTDRSIHLVQLYPKDMNIYGDWGNTLALKRRLERYGYAVRLSDHDPGDPFPADADLLVGGGGQDSGQFRVQEDLQRIAPELRAMAADGVPLLAICGLYQLLGHEFRTASGEVLPGIGLLDATTAAGPTRLIGNIVLESPEFGTVVGYEKHSGLTRLGPGQDPLGRVVKGAGNNGEDGTEGARVHHVVASYLHGSLLPKNPAVADHLIRAAVERRHGSFDAEPLDDTLAERAREAAIARPR